MHIYIEHFLAGLMFAASGAYASNYCRHLWHRIAVGILLVALETLIVVSFVG